MRPKPTANRGTRPRRKGSNVQMAGSRARGILATALLVGLVATACAGSSTAGGGATPTPTPSPTAIGGRPTMPALQLAVLKGVGGRLSYCDPDQFPVAHGTPLENAEARIGVIRADAPAWKAIQSYLNLSPNASLTPQQLIAVNEAYKQLKAIQLNVTDDGYAFVLLVPSATDPAGNQEVRGVVDRTGEVRIVSRGPGHRIACPICLALGTTIETPSGAVPVQDVRPGMSVWTLDRQGRRVVGVVVRTGSTAVPLGHEVVHLVLTDGRSLLASPGHPTVDGRQVGRLRPGDRYAGSVVERATLVPYAAPQTFDLLPSGPTGVYFADGIPLLSTLAA